MMETINDIFNINHDKHFKKVHKMQQTEIIVNITTSYWLNNWTSLWSS